MNSLIITLNISNSNECRLVWILYTTCSRVSNKLPWWNFCLFLRKWWHCRFGLSVYENVSSMNEVRTPEHGQNYAHEFIYLLVFVIIQKLSPLWLKLDNLEIHKNKFDLVGYDVASIFKDIYFMTCFTQMLNPYLTFAHFIVFASYFIDYATNTADFSPTDISAMSWFKKFVIRKTSHSHQLQTHLARGEVTLMLEK